MIRMSNFFGRIVMSYPFYIHAATSSTASQHPCRLFFAAAAVAAPFILISNNAYAALNCTTQPSCQQLGYSKSDVDGCQNYLYCPFDKNYKACIQLEEDDPCTVKTYEGLMANIGNTLCPIITLKNDIDATNIADNTIFGLSANQTLDGAGYSLKLNNQTFTLDKASQIKNIKLTWSNLAQNAITINDENSILSDIDINLKDYRKYLIYLASGSLAMEGNNRIDLTGNMSTYSAIRVMDGTLDLKKGSSLDIDIHDAESSTPYGIELYGDSATIDGTLNITYDNCPNSSSGIRVGISLLTINGTVNINQQNVQSGSLFSSAMSTSTSGTGTTSGSFPVTVNGSLNITQSNLSFSRTSTMSALSGHLLLKVGTNGKVVINQSNIKGLSSIVGLNSNIADIYGDVTINQRNIETTKSIWAIRASGISTSFNLGFKIRGNVTVNQSSLRSPETYFIASGHIGFPSASGVLTTSNSDKTYNSSNAGIEGVQVMQGTKGAKWVLKSKNYNRTWTCSTSYTDTKIGKTAIPPSTYWK